MSDVLQVLFSIQSTTKILPTTVLAGVLVASIPVGEAYAQQTGEDSVSTHQESLSETIDTTKQEGETFIRVALGEDEPDPGGAEGQEDVTEFSATGPWSIPDEGSRSVWFTNNNFAPSGATITDIEYRLRIVPEEDAGNFYAGDYEIFISSSDSEGANEDNLVYDNLGGATDGGYDDDPEDDSDIYLDWRSTGYFDGELANQYWGTKILDTFASDTGELEYLELRIHWETTDPPAISVTPGEGSYSFGEVPVGDSETMDFTVENTGGETLTVEPSLTGSDTGQFSITNGASLSLGPGESYTFIVEYAPNETDSHQVDFEMVHNGENIGSPWVATLGGEGVLPDLTVDDITVNGGDPPQAGEEVEIQTTIAEIAGQPAGQADLDYFVNGTKIGDDQTANLGPNETDEETTNYSFDQSGDYFVSVEVDPDNEIEEGNEGNNSLNATVTVVNSEITVTNPSGGETWELGSIHPIEWSSQDLENANIDISLYQNGNEVESIVSGTSNDGSYTWSIPEDTDPGDYEMQVAASDGSVSDQSGTFTLEEPAVPSIQVSPQSLSFTVPPGGTSSESFTIENTGSADLDWSVTTSGSSSQGDKKESGESFNQAEVLTQLHNEAKKGGQVPVIVRLDVRFQPEGYLSSTAAQTQRGRIGQSQQNVITGLQQGDAVVENVRRYQTVPYIALSTNETGVEMLSDDPNVEQVYRDKPVPPTLGESISIVGADDAWSSGYSGGGKAIGVLDTGVDSDHEALSGKVVREACYSNGGGGGTTVCPGGGNEETGPGTAQPCGTDECDHGTHVAGIAAGSGDVQGVAKDANLIAIQVFTRFTGSICDGDSPCALSYVSDQISALEFVYENRNNHDITSINLSLGSGDNQDPCAGDSREDIIENLRSAGISTVASSGNDSFTDGINAPACIPSVISVGSTEDGSLGTTVDEVSSFSNSADFLDLLAPGEVIESAVPGNSYANKQGTSMAAPHVAGAWAVYKSKYPNASVAQALNALSNSGVPITDSRNGITTPRIQIDQALSETSWLSFEPQSGTVAPGNSESVQVSVDASGLSAGSYNETLQVQSNDPDDETVNVSVELTVEEDNQPPTVTLDPPSTSIDENNTPPTLVSTINVNDDGSGTNNLSLSGADAGNFQIDGSDLEFTATADFETKSSYSVTVEVNDPNVGSDPDDSESFSLSINDVNEAPTVATNAGLSISEGETKPITTDELNASDPDEGDGASDLTFDVTSGPTQGDLLVNGSQASSFTQADLGAGNVEYDHTASNADDDSFEFDLTDDQGAGPTGQTFSIPVSAEAVPQITVTNPSGDESWEIGTTHTIEWTSQDLQDSPVDIELLQDGNLVTTLESGATDDGSYEWTISEDRSPGTGYAVQVSASADGVDASDESGSFALEDDSGTDPPIVPVAESPQQPGSEFWIDIRVGSESNNVENLNQIGFDLDFEQQHLNHVDDEEGSFLGDVQYFSSVDSDNGVVEIGVTRTDDEGVSGSGVVARVQLAVGEDVADGTELTFSLQNVEAEDPNDDPIDLDPQDLALTVQSGITVWPGDMDNDGEVDQFDIFPLGDHYGATGPARADEDQGCEWRATTAQPWTPEEATYADADGDGEVNQFDIFCLGDNYGETHNNEAAATTSVAGKEAPSTPRTGRLALDISKAEGRTVWVTIRAREVKNLLGFGTELSYPAEDWKVQQVEPATWLGEDLLSQTHVDAETGRVGIGISRKGTGRSGSGRLVRLKLRPSMSAEGTAKAALLDKLQLLESAGRTAGGHPIDFRTEKAASLETPEQLVLNGGHPNPVRSSATIEYALPEGQHVRLTVFDVLGRRVATLVDRRQTAGRKTVPLNVSAEGLSSGTYLLRLTASGTTKTSHITVMR